MDVAKGDRRGDGEDAFDATTHALQKAGVMTKRHAAPPSALMIAQDTTEHNMAIVQNFFRQNWNFLVQDHHWNGPLGTLPFWEDRTLRQQYVFSVSTESPS